MEFAIMTKKNHRTLSPSTKFTYKRGTDGCDRTFDIYEGEAHFVSFHFWYEAAEAEAKAKDLVAAMTLLRAVQIAASVAA
jgi:hypothetical protein